MKKAGKMSSWKYEKILRKIRDRKNILQFNQILRKIKIYEYLIDRLEKHELKDS